MAGGAPARADREAGGVGCRRRRTEDARFIRGKGAYVDDLKLPGILFGDFVRSPHAHARIRRLGVSKAALPGVEAILTAAEPKPLNLHYRPTLAGDVQAALADEKVLFQSQQVACVVADDRYVAADAVELVEVEYEALPVLVDTFRAPAEDAPVLRENLAGKTDDAHGARRHHNHIFSWEVGDEERTNAICLGPAHRLGPVDIRVPNRHWGPRLTRRGWWLAPA